MTALIGICQNPDGEGLWFEIDRYDQPCAQPGCECTPRVYVTLTEHQRTINEDWIPALEAIDRLKRVQSDLRLAVQDAEHQRRLVARREHGGVSPQDWADLIDTFRVIVRARTGQRVPNRAGLRPRCFCGAPLAREATA